MHTYPFIAIVNVIRYSSTECMTDIYLTLTLENSKQRDLQRHKEMNRHYRRRRHAMPPEWNDRKTQWREKRE